MSTIGFTYYNITMIFLRTRQKLVVFPYLRDLSKTAHEIAISLGVRRHKIIIICTVLQALAPAGVIASENWPHET